MKPVTGDARSALRAAAIRRLRRVTVTGLVLHGLAYRSLAETAVYSVASGPAQLAAQASALFWGHSYLCVPLAIAIYRLLEQRVIETMSLFALHETIRLDAVLWLGAIVALWYPWHRACNCLEFLSETGVTIATLPALAILLFAIGLASQRSRR